MRFALLFAAVVTALLVVGAVATWVKYTLLTTGLDGALS